MANDNDSVDSNGNSTDLRPRRSNRAKGKPIHILEETDENVIIHNNVVYKVGDFVYYLDKKQDIYRIGLIEEFKFQKRDKLVNKRPEISVKQFYRLDEIPSSVLSNHGEYDTHVMPHNFPEWLRQREIFLSDNALSTSCNSLRSLCTVRHFPDLSHAMALFSTSQASGQVTNSSPRIDHHSLIAGKDNGCIPIPKQRDDNTFFYVYSYNARGRKLAATYLEIRVGPAYQAELPELQSIGDKLTDPHLAPGFREQLIWKPNQIPEAVFAVYNMATVSIACFSGFGGGIDDSASVENGKKIATHMLTCQKALDCLHKSQYNMEKAMEIFAENSLPETSKMPFLWTDEDHLLFDESVKIHGKNFLRIKQDKRNKKGRLVEDYVTFYYYWKKNRPKNKKFTTKKNLRSRASNVALSELAGTEGDEVNKQAIVASSTDNNGSSKPNEGDNQCPSESSIECCVNCKTALPKEEELSLDSDKTLLSDRMKLLCVSCQHYLRRYGYQRPLDNVKKLKCSDDGDFEDGVNGFDEEEDDEDGDEDEEDDVFCEENSVKTLSQSTIIGPSDNKNMLAINKYDFDEDDENVEEVTSLLKMSHAKYNPQRESESSKNANLPNKSAIVSANGLSVSTKTTPVKSEEYHTKSNKRSSLLRKSITDNLKKRRVDPVESGGAISTRSTSVTGRNSLLNLSVRNQIHESLKSNLSQSLPGVGFSVKSSGPIDPNEKHSSVHDSNSLTSSSSSTSNDSSLSSDEADTLPSVKRTIDSHKFPTTKLDTDKNAQTDQPSMSDNSYNQMITSIPNIPGVCAVSNVGEPMPQLTRNLCTDLSATQSSSVSDLNITDVEPLYKQLSTRNPSQTTASNQSHSKTPPETMPALHKIYNESAPSDTVAIPIIQSLEPVAKFVNFNAISNQRSEPNPEEVGLNLVKPKKRTDTAFNDNNWAPAHDSPSKLVHHRGDNSIVDSSLNEALKQMINDCEVVHGSIFGHIIRVVKSTEETCSRTDLQHTISSLKPSDLDKRRAYLNSVKISDLSGIVIQDSCRRLAEEPKKPGSMPPPIDKNPLHHPSLASSSLSLKNFSNPLLTHSSNTGANGSQSLLSNHAHARKVSNNSNHGLRSPSPANSNNRVHNSFQPISANMIRPNHMINSNLHNLSSPANNPRPNMHMNPNMQSVAANNPLLADYINMNKVNMNDLLFYQNPAQANYEEMAKYQELQNYLMMHNMAMSPVRPMQWDPRFGPNIDGWNGSMGPVGGMGPGVGVPGGLPMGGPDMQNILRALALPGSLPSLSPQQQQINANNNRPRSATGLNLTNGGGGGDNKPGSGRASVNHDYQRQLVAQEQQQQQQQAQMGDSPEMMEAFRVLMCRNLMAMQHKMPPGSMHQPPPQQQVSSHHGPPMAHALTNAGGTGLNFGGVPGHLAALQSPQTLLNHIQAQSSSSSSKPPSANNATTFATHNNNNNNQLQQQQNINDYLQMLLECSRNNAPR